MKRRKKIIIHHFTDFEGSKGVVFMHGNSLSATVPITIFTKYTDEFEAYERSEHRRLL